MKYYFSYFEKSIVFSSVLLSNFPSPIPHMIHIFFILFPYIILLHYCRVLFQKYPCFHILQKEIKLQVVRKMYTYGTLLIMAAV